MTSPLAQASLFYGSLEWYIFPVFEPKGDGCSCLRADCQDIGKHPRTQHGLKDASNDRAVIERWWRMWPNSNIGVRTGPESKIFVLDFDTEAALLALQSEHGQLPPTATVRTSRGYHLYFEYPDFHVKTTSGKLMPKVDTRGAGGYAILPPSVHESGVVYRWVSAPGVGPAKAPDWLLAAIKGLGTSPKAGTANPDDPILDGQRNGTLFALGCAMRHHGAPEAAIAAALEITNESRCVPPLGDVEITRLAASIMRYNPEKKTPLDGITSNWRTGWIRHL